MAEKSDELQKLQNLVDAGNKVPAGNLSGMRSGVSQNGRELTAAEAAWQQRNAQVQGDDKKAEKIANARYDAMSRAIRHFSDSIGHAVYGDDPVKKGRIVYASIDGGATPRNDLAAPAPPDQPQDALSALAQQSAAPEPNVGGPFAALYEKAMAAVKGALKAPSGAPYGDGLSQLASSLSGAASAPAASPSAPAAPAPTASPQMPTLKMVASGGTSIPAYEYGGNTILLGDGIDANDASAVQDYMNNTNRIIDMMNAAYA